MTGFETWTSGIRSDRSANWATTTILTNLLMASGPGLKCWSNRPQVELARLSCVLIQTAVPHIENLLIQFSAANNVSYFPRFGGLAEGEKNFRNHRLRCGEPWSYKSKMIEIELDAKTSKQIEWVCVC